MNTPQYKTRKQKGATLVEFVVVAPALFMLMLGAVQIALASHAKSQVYYATYEAARAASTVKQSEQASALRDAFERAMVGYYGGGTTQSEINNARTAAQSDLSSAVNLSYENIDDKYITVKAMFGIPPEKQVAFFLSEMFMKTVLPLFMKGEALEMVQRGRIPVSAEVTMHLSPIAMSKVPWKKDVKDNQMLFEGAGELCTEEDPCLQMGPMF